jgi:hypothetical protein
MGMFFRGVTPLTKKMKQDGAGAMTRLSLLLRLALPHSIRADQIWTSSELQRLTFVLT